MAERLRLLGHDVAEAYDRGPDPGDETLLAWAVAEKRILVTMDKDFGTLVFVGGAQHCGIIRLPHVRSAHRLALMKQILSTHAPAELDCAIVTVRGNRIRVTRGPRDDF